MSVWHILNSFLSVLCRVWWTTVRSWWCRSSSCSFLCSSDSDNPELTPWSWVQLSRRRTGRHSKVSISFGSGAVYSPNRTKESEFVSEQHYYFFAWNGDEWYFVKITCFSVHRRMLSLIQTNLPMAKEQPLLLISWLSLVAFEDIPEFSNLTGIHAEHLIQSLMYRLRACGETRDYNRAQENIKVQYSHLK